MALPTAVDLRNYLRLSTTAEDTLLGDLVARAREVVENLTGLPIEAEARVWEVQPADDPRFGCGTVLFCPVWPLDGDSVTVTDADGDTVADSTYTVTGRTGRIKANTETVFTSGWYTVTADVGWGTLADYATRIEPVLASAILDVAADLAQRRNPNAQAEGTGGGIYTQWAPREDVLARVRGALHRLRPARVG